VDFLYILKSTKEPGVVIHLYNPSIREAEAGRSGGGSQPELHKETLSQNKQKTIATTDH
jgi:hypothetical protein